MLTAVKAEKPGRRLVLSIVHTRRSGIPPTRLPEDHVRALRERTAIVHAVCDPVPEGRREQPCNTPGLTEGAFIVSLGPARMQPNGEVVVSVEITTPEQPGVSEIRGIRYVLRRQDGQWFVDRIVPINGSSRLMRYDRPGRPFRFPGCSEGCRYSTHKRGSARVARHEEATAPPLTPSGDRINSLVASGKAG